MQKASSYPSANCSACSQFGDKTPSGLTSQSSIPASQTKHTDCQSKQTSLLTTKFCLHNSFLLKKKKVQKPILFPMEFLPPLLLVKERTGSYVKSAGCTPAWGISQGSLHGLNLGRRKYLELGTKNQSGKPASTPH